MVASLQIDEPKDSKVFILGPSEYILIVLLVVVLYILARRSASLYRASAKNKAA